MSDKRESTTKPDGASGETAKRSRAGIERLALSLAVAAVPAVASAGETISTKPPVAPHITLQPKTQQKNATSNALSTNELKGISGAGGKTKGSAGWIEKQGGAGWVQ